MFFTCIQLTIYYVKTTRFKLLISKMTGNVISMSPRLSALYESCRVLTAG